MALSVIAANTSLKVNGAVSASRGTDGTLYTCPANSYAIVNLSIDNDSGSPDGVILFSIDGKKLVSGSIISSGAAFFNGQSTLAGGNYGDTAVLTSVFVGPGQSLTVDFVSGGSGSTAYVTGVEFINSP